MSIPPARCSVCRATIDLRRTGKNGCSESPGEGVVYRVVNMLVYFDPSAMCHLPDDLVLAPLPARRQLWEAGNESAWGTERHRGPPNAQVSFGLTAGGEVVRLDEDRLSCGDAWVSPRRASDAGTVPSQGWEEWCSGMDDFGGLVMLAASLLG
ncbi:hypothetical protein FJTKL_04955 [Diaporthe vaccinii]|uniref:Uncharacterized protein n=1 Tax=Diaporthe vaccinii TaxID=105482 RepID=A0ABR4EYX9_9PEZI